MKRMLFSLLALGALSSTPALAVDGDAILGGAIGGGVGAAVGSEIGGRNGAIAGGAIGAAVGVAVATDDNDHAEKSRVIYVEEQRHRHGPHGRAWGYYAPPGHTKHKHHHD